MKTKGPKGFTLIEILIVIAIGAILLSAIGVVLVSGHIFLNRAWKSVGLQRDASYAMLRMSHSIKAGRSAELENYGKGIKIYRETDWIRYFLEDGSKDLKCEIEGGQPQIVVNGNVEDLGFTLEAYKIGIDLTLKKDNLQNHFVSTVMMRNYGE